MKKIYFIILFTSILFSCEKPISDFQSKNFVKFFGSGNESKGNDVIELLGGGYLIVGSDLVNSNDYQIYACKIDGDGNLIWSNTYGDGALKDEGKTVKEVSDGFIISGTSVEAGGLVHSFLMKINQYGDVRWTKFVGKQDCDIAVNDIVVEGASVYLAGSSDTLLANKTDYYVSKLDTSGNKIWDKHFQISLNSSFQRVFSNNDELILVGTDGTTGKASIFLTPKTHFGINSSAVAGNSSETAGDACFYGSQLLILLNNGVNSSALENLNTGLSQVWRTNDINSIVAKSVAMKNDGTIIIAGENTLEGTTYINFIKVDNSGEAYYGNDVFRTFQGNVGKVLKTNDDGLILVGTTASTFGKTIQLIKTDKDYFMLKN